VLPPEAVLLAAARWLRLLQRSSVEQAAAIIRADAALADLSVTQYSQGLEWLAGIGLLEEGTGALDPSGGLGSLSPSELHELLLAATLDAARPPWLQDADLLVRDTADLPQDIVALARTLDVGDEVALRSIAAVHGKMDLEQRALVGSAGELGLIAVLEEEWPGSTYHVAADHDGFGYDVAFRSAGETWHLEVKSTSRLGRLVIHVSRHEHEVALRDPAWQLVAAGLDGDSRLECLATISYPELAARAPRELHPTARWESVRYAISPENLTGGLAFVPGLTASASRYLGASGMTAAATGFAWMPAAEC
jgi:hypothetical protein